MAQSTIPQLQETESIDENALILVDSGIQSYKVKAFNFIKSLMNVFSSPISAAKTENYQVLVTDNVILLDPSSGGFNVTLPDPAEFLNRTLTLKDISGAIENNNVSVLPNDGEDIEGVTVNSLDLQINYGSWSFVTDGTNWFLI